MKIVVTGSNGYIGTHVINELIKDNNQVLAISHEEAKSYNGYCNFNPKVKIFSGSKNIYEELGRPDVCIHLAWNDGFIHNSKSHMSNLSAHFRFLTDIIDGGLPNLSIMGTMHEVGYYVGSINEETPCNPQSQYGIAKNALRQSVLNYCVGKKCTIKWLRAYYITGDDKRANSIFSKILIAEKQGNGEFPFNSGKNKYDFIDVDELAKMIYRASVQTRYSGIINVCSGKAVPLSEKVEKFIEDNKLKIKLRYGAYPDRPYDSPEIFGDATIISEIMGNKYDI